MAAMISGITLFREKSTVHRFGFGNQNADEDVVFQIRSNRVILPMRSGGMTENVVVRGQNVPSTLRLTALVLNQFNRNPAMFTDNPAQTTDWAELWKNRISNYEKQFQPDSWVSLYHGGETIFATNLLDNQIEEIEHIALGGDINDATIRKVTNRLLGEDADVVTQHDSQTAVVFSPFKEYHRAAILERRGGRTASFAVSVHHPPKPRKPVRYAGFINFCADTIEALNLKVFLDHIKQMIDEHHISGPVITPAQMAGAISRKRDLMQFIVAYEQANKITYRPERPEFF